MTEPPMTQRHTSAKARSKAVKSRNGSSSAATAAELQARAALEEARHQQLCQLLEHTVQRHCDDYLRQLATTAVQVKTMAEIAAMQAQLLQQMPTPPKDAKAKKPSESPVGSGNQVVSTYLKSLFTQ